MQHGTEDESRLMPLAEKTVESEETLCRQETFFANGDAEDVKGHLDAIEVEIFSADVNSNVRLDENERESKHTAFRGKPARDQAVKIDSQELTCSFYLVSPENAEDGNKSKGDNSHDGEVLPKEFTCFEQQMALGMVSGLFLFLFLFCFLSYHHFTSTLTISSNT